MKALLSASVEKFRHLDLIDNKDRDEGLNTTSSEASDQKIVEQSDYAKSRKKVSQKNSQIGTKNSEINVSVKKPRQVLNRKTHTVNHFTPEEDKILLEAMSSGEELNFTKLGKRMNRK